MYRNVEVLRDGVRCRIHGSNSHARILLEKKKNGYNDSNIDQYEFNKGYD